MEEIMGTLKQNITRVYEPGDMNELPVAAGSLIYAGAAIGDNGRGYMRPLEGSDKFRGFAEEYVDNVQGGDGEKTVRFRRRGSIVLKIKGITWENVGQLVHALNDNTFTLNYHQGSYVGRIARLDKAGRAVVDFDTSLKL
jgi:hypothetical protein